jgi:hypothetical protein
MATDADREINNLVVTLTSFIRNVAEAKQKGMVKVDDAELRKVLSIAASSIEQAVSKAHGQIEGTKRALREVRGH